MNFINLVLCIGSMICSIWAVLIGGEILPPLDPIDLSVFLLIMMAIFFVNMAVNNYSKGEDDGEDQSED